MIGAYISDLNLCDGFLFAVKVQQISTHKCFANVLNGNSKWKSIGNSLPMIKGNLSDFNLCDGFLCCKSSANKHI